jgi:hypothetical protein
MGGNCRLCFHPTGEAFSGGPKRAGLVEPLGRRGLGVELPPDDGAERDTENGSPASPAPEGNTETAYQLVHLISERRILAHDLRRPVPSSQQALADCGDAGRRLGVGARGAYGGRKADAGTMVWIRDQSAHNGIQPFFCSAEPRDRCRQRWGVDLSGGARCGAERLGLAAQGGDATFRERMGAEERREGAAGLGGASHHGHGLGALRWIEAGFGHDLQSEAVGFRLVLP